jgi:hypothetical protein
VPILCFFRGGLLLFYFKFHGAMTFSVFDVMF